MEKFTAFESKVAIFPVDNIDTDQIIPARFLKTISKAGLGDQLFYDYRYESDGTPKPDALMNQAATKQCQVLLAGDNFGCGSSREHAPWALTQYGFRAIVSTSFADIFKGNSLKNGLLPVVVDAATHAELLTWCKTGKVAIDLAARTLNWNGKSVTFPIDEFSRTCLLEGVDELGYILQQDSAIAAFEAKHTPAFSTLNSD